MENAKEVIEIPRRFQNAYVQCLEKGLQQGPFEDEYKQFEDMSESELVRKIRGGELSKKDLVNLARKYKKTQAVQDVNEAFYKTRDFQSTLDNIVDKSTKRFGLSQYEIVVFDCLREGQRIDDTNKIEILTRYSKNFSDESLENMREGPLLHTMHYVLENEEALFCPNTELDPFETEAKKNKVGSWVTIPLTVSGKKIGYIHLTKEEKKGFKTNELSYLERSGHAIAEKIMQTAISEQNALLAVTDELTGINNRRQFYKILKHYVNITQDSISKKNKIYLSVGFIDADRFKPINDTYGHATGDIVLIKVTEAIEKHMQRKLDFVARYGGDEFVIALFADERETVTICENIRRDIAKLRIKDAKTKDTISLSATIGIATLRYDETGQEILIRADSNLYHGKGEVHDRAEYKKDMPGTPRNKVVSETILKYIFEKGCSYEEALQKMLLPTLLKN